MSVGNIASNTRSIFKKARYHLLVLGFFFLYAMHYMEAFVGGTGLYVPANIVSWIPVSFLIGLGLIRIARVHNVQYTSQTLWLLLCVCLLSIPTFYPASLGVNESPVHLALLGGFLFYFSMQQFRPGEKEFSFIFLMLLASILYEALLGWQQYLGISGLHIEGPGTAVPYGNIRQRNVFSTFLVVGMVLSVGLLEKQFISGRFAILNRVFAFSCVLAPVLFLPLIVLLKSRTGWVSLAVVMLLIVPQLWQKKSRVLQGMWLAAVLAGFLVVPVMNSVTAGAEVVAIEKLNLSGPRNFIYEQSIGLALEKPLLGHGVGNYESAYNLHAAQGYAEGKYQEAGYANLDHPHNELLYWWIEGGVVALGGLLLAAGVVLKNLFSCRDRLKWAYMLALLFPIVFHTQTEIPFYSSVTLWVYFLLVVLYVDRNTQEAKSRKLDYYLMPMALGVMIPVVVTAFMITTLYSGRLLNTIESDMTVQVSTLEEISNPVVWQDRLMWDMNFGLLALAVYENRPELAANYIQWATQVIKRKPRAGYYQFLVVAYKVIGDDTNADLVQKEAEFRFPDKDFNFDLDVFVGMDKKNIDDVQVNTVDE